jgi:lipopolysaccharide transport system permease protein
MLKDLYTGIRAWRFLIWQLVRTSLLAQYKKSFIGMAWMFILPLLAVAVWIVLKGAGIVNPGDMDDVPYPVYVLLGTSIWAFFLDMYRNASQAIVGNGRLLVMKDFPGEVLLAHRVVEHLILFSIPLTINIIVLLAFGIRFQWHALLFPLALLPLLLLALSIGMVIAVFRVVAVDFATIIDEGMKLLMFLTPIVYTSRVEVAWLQHILHWNPLTYLIGFPRDLLTRGVFFEWETFVLCSGLAIVLFFGALLFYKSTAKRALERLTIV